MATVGFIISSAVRIHSCMITADFGVIIWVSDPWLWRRNADLDGNSFVARFVFWNRGAFLFGGLVVNQLKQSSNVCTAVSHFCECFL